MKYPQIIISILLSVFFAINAVQAGGPLVVTNTGVPYTWDNSVAIIYNPDKGKLGSLTNDEAVEMIKKGFDAWGNLSTVILSFGKGNALSANVDSIDTFNEIYGVKDGINALVFDENGNLFNDLGFDPSVLGFAGPEFISTRSPFTIAEGFAMFNGAYLDGKIGNGEMDPNQFLGVFVHEFGHFLGLDHSQVNVLDILNGTTGATFRDLETMSPFLIFGSGEEQVTPNPDDIAAISTLYPKDFFQVKGSIKGRIYSPDGKTQFQGANVKVRNINDPYFDAITNVSGARYFPSFTYPVNGETPSNLEGLYEINGLTPGESYAVQIEAISPDFTSGSSVGPLDPPVVLPGPEEYYNGNNESNSPSVDDPSAFTTIVVVAGETVSDIDIIVNKTVTGSSSLFGAVTNQKTNKPIKNAQVRLNDNGVSSRTKTNAEGEYLFLDLDAGTYTVRVKKTGFKAQNETVFLNEDEDKELNIQLKKKKK